jgi:hypothetical protein
MNLMKVNGYQARILYDEMTGQLPVEILRWSGWADLLDSIPINFVESSKGHWMSILKSAKSNELGQASIA